MSLEALWTVKFEDATVQGWVNGGVVVLETGRIFGGDSAYYYLGTFELDGDRFTADVRVVHYSGDPTTTFGTTETDFKIQLEGQRSGDTIQAEMWRVAAPNLRLPTILERKADLP